MQPNSNDPKSIAKSMRSQIGSSGTFITSGILTQEEYNSNLVGQQGRRIFDVMRRSDGTVHAALQACKLPILAVDFSIQPASDDPKDIYIADFVKNELFNRNIDFHSLIREALTMLDFGFSVFEKTYEVMQFDGHVQFGIKTVGSRKQRTVLYWQTADGKRGIQQQLLGMSADGIQGLVSIPIEKLIIFTNNKEGENYEGISLLRFAYKDWDIKDKLGIVNAIALEKMSIGVPVLYVPAQADANEKAKARETLRQFRANEEAYMELPATSTDNWKLEMLDMKASTVKDVLPSIQYHDKQILLSVLAQFLNLGSSGSSGSRAVSKDHSELFMLSEEATIKTIVSTLQMELINQLVDLNFSDLQNGYPKLISGRISDDSITTLSGAINQLMTAGAVTPDPELEGWIRKSLHAPELPDEYKNDYENRPMPKQQTKPDGQIPAVDSKTGATKAAVRAAVTARDRLLTLLAEE